MTYRTGTIPLSGSPNFILGSDFSTLAAVPATKLWLAADLHHAPLCCMISPALFAGRSCLAQVTLYSFCRLTFLFMTLAPATSAPQLNTRLDMTLFGCWKELWTEWTTQEYDYLFRMLLIGDSGLH